MKYTKEILVSFDQSDPAGLLFFGNILPLTHQTIEAFVDHIGIGWGNWFNNDRLAVPIRHAESDFLKPIPAGSTLKTNLSITKLSETTVTFHCAFLLGEDVAMEAKTTHVFIDKSNGQKAEMPADFKEKLGRYLV